MTSFLLVLLAAGSAFPVQRKLQFATAVEQIHGVTCSESEIAIDEQRQFGAARVYVLDACGRKLEIEEGLALPASYSELDVLSAEEMTQLAGNLAKSHFVVTPSIEMQVAAWCEEEGARRDGETIAQCRLRLPRALQPIGVEEREDGSVDIWFKLGDRAFVGQAGLFRPTCQHLILRDTPDACRCGIGTNCATPAERREARVERDEPEHGVEDEVRAPLAVVHGRGEFGVTYLRTRVAGNETYRGAGFGGGIFTGASVRGIVAVTGGLTLQKGFHRERIQLPECSEFGVCSSRPGRTDVGHVGVWLKASLYPFRTLGLHLDAAAGGLYAWQNYDPQYLRDMDSGLAPAFFLGAGYEVMPDERWILGVAARQTLMPGGEVSGSATDGLITLGTVVD